MNSKTQKSNKDTLKKRIILIGASGHGKVCGEIAELSGYTDIIFLDDDEKITNCGKYPVAGPGTAIRSFVGSDTVFFVSIGNSSIRKRFLAEISALGGNIATLIHPDATISQSASLGKGTVVMAGAVVSADAKIGSGCIINTSSSVDHDCNIQDYVHIAVGAHVCGTVNIGNNTWVGAGAIVSNNLNICNDCMIGAGATVTNDILEPGTYVGVPARKKMV